MKFGRIEKLAKLLSKHSDVRVRENKFAKALTFKTMNSDQAVRR